METGRELLQLYYSVNADGSVNTSWEPEFDNIMEMTDVNGDGHVTFAEMEGTLQAIAKLFNYEIEPVDRGEMEFLWSMMDVNKDGSLSPAEVKKVLSNTPLIKKINVWAQDKMLKAAKVEKDKAR